MIPGDPLETRQKRWFFLYWSPMGKMVVLNALPFVFCVVCVRLFVPASERPVFWAFVALVTLGWAALIWGSSFLLTVWVVAIRAARKALRGLLSSDPN